MHKEVRTAHAFRERLPALDNLRTFLALLGFPLHAVFFLAGSFFPLHAVSDGNLAQYTQEMSGPTKLYFLSVCYIHVFRMGAFFLLAGFFARSIYHKYGRKKFILDRMYKIGLPFLVCQFWAVSLYSIFFGVYHFFPSIFPEVVHGFLAQLYAAGGGFWGRVNSLSFVWFLYFLTWFYTLTFIVLYLKRHSPLLLCFLRKTEGYFFALFSSRWCCITVGLFCGALLSQQADFDDVFGKITFLPPLGFISAYGVWYILGWWLWGHQDKFTQFFARCGLKLVLSIVIYSLSLYWYFHFANKNNFSASIVGVLLYQLSQSYAVIALFGMAWRYVSKPSRLLRYISGASYWLYLVQIPVGLLLMPLMMFFNIDDMHNHFIIFSLEASVLCFVIALLSYHLFVRRTWLSSIFGGKNHF